MKEETAVRNKIILQKYRTLRAKKVKQYDALDEIRSGLERPLDYATILHIITEEVRNEREQSQPAQIK